MSKDKDPLEELGGPMTRSRAKKDKSCKLRRGPNGRGLTRQINAVSFI